jgi:hypothetical protein
MHTSYDNYVARSLTVACCLWPRDIIMQMCAPGVQHKVHAYPGRIPG